MRDADRASIGSAYLAATSHCYGGPDGGGNALPGAVDGALFDLVYDAYLGDDAVRAFLQRENADAARVIADRLDAARRLGLWHPRRTDLGVDLLRHAEALP